VDPVLSAELIGRLALAPNIDLFLLTAADVDLATRRWVLDNAGAKTSFVEPARVRPFVAFGIDFTVTGAGRLSSRPEAEHER
jgi:hypothetical protein